MADDAEANTEERPNNGNEFEINELNTKLDQLIAGREKEQILSRMDGLFNVLITISTFIVGLLITQRTLIAANIFVSFPLTCVILTLVVSFVIGTVKGVFGKSMYSRLLSYCLLLSLPLWYITIPITLLFAPPHVSTFEFQAISVVTLTLLIIFSGLISKFFIQWFKKKFEIIFETKYHVSSRIYYDVSLMASLIVALAIVTSVIMYIVWGLPTLLKPTTSISLLLT